MTTFQELLNQKYPDKNTIKIDLAGTTKAEETIDLKECTKFTFLDLATNNLNNDRY